MVHASEAVRRNVTLSAGATARRCGNTGLGGGFLSRSGRVHDSPGGAGFIGGRPVGAEPSPVIGQAAHAPGESGTEASLVRDWAGLGWCRFLDPDTAPRPLFTLAGSFSVLGRASNPIRVPAGKPEQRR